VIAAASPWHDARLAESLLTEGVLTRRLLGWVLDVLLLCVLGAVLTVLVIAFGLLTLGLGFHLWPALTLLPFVYHMGFLLSGLSATPGQAAMGLAVVRNDDLGPPTGAQALVFTLGFYVTLAAGVIWLGVALLTLRHRALHDIVAGLVVVRRQVLPTYGFAGGNRPRRPTARRAGRNSSTPPRRCPART
jgi:uncharacterized RDD family membrane protein YckC